MGFQNGIELSDDRTAVLSYAGGAATASVPDSVTSLPAGLFAHCTQLQSVKLPAALKALPDRLFEGCTSLERVRLPQSVKSVGKGVFAGCTSLKSAPLCPGMTEIAEDMFKGCTGIDAFAAPEGVEEIGQGAFAGCTALETVILSASVTNIAEGAFAGCTSLRRIRVADDNPAYYMEESDGYLRNKSDGEIVLEPSVAEAIGRAAGLLQSEEEIDLTPEGLEEDSAESLEAMNNNFIGDEDSEEQIAQEQETQGQGEHSTPLSSTAQTQEIKEERFDTPPVAATHRPTEDESNMESIDEKLADIMGRTKKETEASGQESEDRGQTADSSELNRIALESDILKQNISGGAEEAAAGTDEIERIALESDILKQNIFKREADEGSTLAADSSELNRIALESDILKQNIGAGDAEETPVAADNSELNRIVFESDILSQNTKGGSEAGVGMEELLLLSKESEILRENTRVANHITLTPTEAAAKVEGEEIEEEKSKLVIFSDDANEGAEENRDTVLERLKNIAVKYESIETAITGGALFVFAERLANDGFSTALVRCAKRLAAIHSLGTIHLFYGLPFDHAEFMQMFTQFILGKNAVYACDVGNTKDLSASARAFAAASNVALDNDSMTEQMGRAQETGGRSFRIILKDDYR